MDNKKSNQVSENLYDKDIMIAEFIDKHLANQDKELPESLLNEMKSYIKRNSMNLPYSIHENSEVCCMRCFKAFSLNKAKEQGVLEQVKDFIDNISDSEVGHSGYYLDGDNLKKETSLS